MHAWGNGVPGYEQCRDVAGVAGSSQYMASDAAGGWLAERAGAMADWLGLVCFGSSRTQALKALSLPVAGTDGARGSKSEGEGTRSASAPRAA